MFLHVVVPLTLRSSPPLTPLTPLRPSSPPPLTLTPSAPHPLRPSPVGIDLVENALSLIRGDA